MIKAAKRAVDRANIKRKNKTLLFGITVLTSLNDSLLKEMNIKYRTRKQAESLAKLGKKSGLDGVVCSAMETAFIKKTCGKDFLVLTPGIRLPDNSSNDQVRIATPQEALKNGSDFLVFGRSIYAEKYPEKICEKLYGDLLKNG
jgi:orotidine-5'-phosphate decarboxylase